MTLANRNLAAAGITNPTPLQTEAALMGGTVTNAQGQSTEMPGVLQLRSQGMGWGRIANATGVHPAQSEQGASRSMRGGSSERVASISASQSTAMTRDNTPAMGASASSLAGSDSARDGGDERGSAFGHAPNRDNRRNQTASAASSAASKASLRNRDSGSSAIGAAASQASLRDRGNSSVSSFNRGGDSSHAGGNHTSLGKDRGTDLRASGAAAAGIADRGKERGVAARAGAGAETSTSLDRSSQGDKKGNGKKH
jgi:hypothetical protein